MPQSILTPRLQLQPVATGDVEWMCMLLWLPEVRHYLCNDALLPIEAIREIIADSLDPSSITSVWRIETRGGDAIGLIGLRPPSTAALRLRAIGWRSLELLVALEPRVWSQGFASDAVDAVAADASRDGVTFALVASVDEPNLRSHTLMRRSGFQELGRARGPVHPMIIYERPV